MHCNLIFFLVYERVTSWSVHSLKMWNMYTRSRTCSSLNCWLMVFRANPNSPPIYHQIELAQIKSNMQMALPTQLKKSLACFVTMWSFLYCILCTNVVHFCPFFFRFNDKIPICNIVSFLFSGHTIFKIANRNESWFFTNEHLTISWSRK